MKKSTKRLLTQAAAAVGANAYIPGYIGGAIFKGPTKMLCFPGLNCYSCPGAFLSCPIGSLQAMLASAKYHFSLYVLGTLLLFGLIAGRWICGWLCPFGLIQDLLYKIPGKKLHVKKGLSRLQLLKYAVLLILVVMLPLLVLNDFGTGSPWFCKYLCPSGTVFAGVPLVASNESLQASVGLLFDWKIAAAIAILVLSVFLYRFFCRFLCPLGAVYGLLNKLSLYRMRVDGAQCTHCGACKDACKMDIDPVKTPNNAECIRCGGCVSACPACALSLGFRDKARARSCGGKSANINWKNCTNIDKKAR